MDIIFNLLPFLVPIIFFIFLSRLIFSLNKEGAKQGTTNKTKNTLSKLMESAKEVNDAETKQVENKEKVSPLDAFMQSMTEKNEYSIEKVKSAETKQVENKEKVSPLDAFMQSMTEKNEYSIEKVKSSVVEKNLSSTKDIEINHKDRKHITEEQQNEYVAFLQDPDNFRKAFIMKEIFDKKF